MPANGDFRWRSRSLTVVELLTRNAQLSAIPIRFRCGLCSACNTSLSPNANGNNQLRRDTVYSTNSSGPNSGVGLIQTADKVPAELIKEFASMHLTEARTCAYTKKILGDICSLLI